MLVSPFATNESSPAEGHAFGRSAEAPVACHAYDFGFNNPQFSDRVLHITREKSSSGSDAGGTAKPHEVAPLLLSMHVNSLTLAANSEVLRRKLEEWTCDGETRELRLEAKPGEEFYLEKLIRFCYSRQVTLTEEKSVLRLMQLADRYLMPECVECCAAALTPMEEVLSLQSAYRYLRLPAGLHNHEPFSQLVQRATSRVQAEFDDLDAVWMNESLQASFLKLPLAALLTVLTSPHLKSITENTVFVAVSHWIHIAATKQKIAQCLEDTAKKLAQCIRFPMLSNDFLHFVASEAGWLPEQYRSGAAFRAAARYKGAPLKLQQQLAQGPGVGVMYLRRRIGVGSSTCIMQWEVPITKIGTMKRKGPESTLRIPGEYYLCGFYWYLIMQFNGSGTSLGCYLHWTAKLNSVTEMSPHEAFVLASTSLSLKNAAWGPDFAQVCSMKKEHSFGGGLGMGWGNPFKVALGADEHEGDLARHLDSAGFVSEEFIDVQFTVDVRLDQ